MPLSDENRMIWLWLLNEGGYWTAREIAQRVGMDPLVVFRRCGAMVRRSLIVSRKGEGQRYLSYGVTGTCLVPKGMTVAEAQA